MIWGVQAFNVTACWQIHTCKMKGTADDRRRACFCKGLPHAAHSHNCFLSSRRWALLYGTILTNARAMGEFGAVSVISGNILGKTQTLTLFVESAYKVS